MVKLDRGNVSRAMSVLLFPREMSGNGLSVKTSWLLEIRDPAVPVALGYTWGHFSASQRPLWMRPFVCIKRNSPGGAAVAVITDRPFIAVTSRPGSSPPDIGVCVK